MTDRRCQRCNRLSHDGACGCALHEKFHANCDFCSPPSDSLRTTTTLDDNARILREYEAKIAAFRERMASDDDLRICVEHMQTEAWEANKSRAVCDGCGLGYGSDGWIECIVPDEVWRQISPTHDEGSLLCITCIARAVKRLGLSDVPVRLTGTEAIRVATQRQSFDAGWECASARIARLESEAQQARAALEAAKQEHEKQRRALIDHADALAEERTRDLRSSLETLQREREAVETSNHNLEADLAELAAHAAKLEREKQALIDFNVRYEPLSSDWVVAGRPGKFFATADEALTAHLTHRDNAT